MSTNSPHVRRPAPVDCPRCGLPLETVYFENKLIACECTNLACGWKASRRKPKPPLPPKPPAQSLIATPHTSRFASTASPVLCPLCNSPTIATRSGAHVSRIECSNPNCPYDHSVIQTKSGPHFA